MNKKQVVRIVNDAIMRLDDEVISPLEDIRDRARKILRNLEEIPDEDEITNNKEDA